MLYNSLSSYQANEIVIKIGKLENHPYLLTWQYRFLNDYRDDAENTVRLLKKESIISKEEYDLYIKYVRENPISNESCRKLQSALSNIKKEIYNWFV